MYLRDNGVHHNNKDFQSTMTKGELFQELLPGPIKINFPKMDTFSFDSYSPFFFFKNYYIQAPNL